MCLMQSNINRPKQWFNILQNTCFKIVSVIAAQAFSALGNFIHDHYIKIGYYWKFVINILGDENEEGGNIKLSRYCLFPTTPDPLTQDGIL